MKNLSKFKDTFNRLELSIISLRTNKSKIKDKLNEYLPEKLKKLEEDKKKKFFREEEHNFEGDLGEQKVKTTYKILRKYSHKTFYSIIKNLNEKEIKKIKEEFEKRLDEKNYLYLRFNKREWFLNNKYVLTNEGNCLHVKCHIQTYPAKRKLAKKKFNQFINELTD